MRRVPQFMSPSILRDSEFRYVEHTKQVPVIKSIPSIRFNFNNLFQNASYFTGVLLNFNFMTLPAIN